MSSSTPGRRLSTRERRSPRNPSPMNTRTPRMSNLSNVETATGAGNDALPKSSGGEVSETTSAHSLNSTTQPASTTRPRIRMTVKPPASQEQPPTSNTETSRRKSGRMSEVSRREPPSSSGGAEQDEFVKGSNRVEESGDDDYNPSGRPSKAKRARKSLDPVNETRPSTQDATEDAALATKHQGTVQAAIAVARDKDNPTLAITLKLLYQQSLLKKSLAHLLEQILTQKASPRQVGDFQTHVKAARKDARALVEGGLSDADFMLNAPRSIQPKQPSPTKVTPPVLAPAPKKSQQPVAHKKQVVETAPLPTSRGRSQVAETAPLPTGRGRPSAAVAARARGIGKQPASSPPASTRQTAAASSRYGTPQGELAMTTRNSKKRPSATPEPTSRAQAQAGVHGNDDRPRKRARRSPAANQGGDDADVMMTHAVDDSLSDLDSDSALSELVHSSPDPPVDIENELAGKDQLSSTVHSFKRGGRKLKQKPEPSQKVKTTAATKHGIGLPDDQMMSEKQRFADQYNRLGPKATFSEIRESREPSGLPRSRRPPPIDIDGVFTPAAREQLERQGLQSPATSSVQGELLIPPPEFAKLNSRATTPALNGRPGRGSRQGQVSRMKNS